MKWEPTEYYSPDMDPNLYDLLLDRLQQQRVNNNETPALLRDLSKILESNPGIDPGAANSKLNLLGWNGVALDYQSLQLALALMESENPGYFQPGQFLWPNGESAGRVSDPVKRLVRRNYFSL